ncbi:MAG: exonuclease domain-containing protein [Muribaculaceae bacterium]
MELNLKKPLVFFDLETTGVNYSHDKIVELSYVKVMPNGTKEENTYRFNPEMHIPEQATAVHHITDADVADCPTFRMRAKEIFKVFEGSDIAGYNSNRFDVPMLIEEFLRAGVNFDYTRCRFIDVQTIFHKMEQRTLVAAYKFYCNKDLEAAHSANADTMATYEVLKAQLDRYENLQNDVDFLAEFSAQNKNVDLAGRFVYDENRVPVFNFGKYKGQPVIKVLERDSGYYGWMMQGDFPQDTKNVLTNLRLQSKQI